MSHDRDVFINCPFDRKYQPLLRALLFAVYDCGFRARSALEVEDSGEVRVQKILRIIVLDEEPYRYQKYCSDIAGQDIRAHGGKPLTAIEIVRNWLSTTPAVHGTVIPSGSVIAGRYRMYRAALPARVSEATVESTPPDVCR